MKKTYEEITDFSNIHLLHDCLVISNALLMHDGWTYNGKMEINTKYNYLSISGIPSFHYEFKNSVKVDTCLEKNMLIIGLYGIVIENDEEFNNALTVMKYFNVVNPKYNNPFEDYSFYFGQEEYYKYQLNAWVKDKKLCLNPLIFNRV